MVVDTLGLPLAVDVQDRDGTPSAVSSACSKRPTIERLHAESAYAGQCAERIAHDNDIAAGIVSRLAAVGEWGTPRQSLRPTCGGGFVILPKRWVVERTHAWLERSRRLVMHTTAPTETPLRGLGSLRRMCCCRGSQYQLDFV